MAKIVTVKRNEEGNCIVFEGAKAPTFFNTCLSAEINSSNSNNINIVNDIKTGFAVLELNGTDGSSSNAGDNILLDGTDEFAPVVNRLLRSGTNQAGDHKLLLESNDTKEYEFFNIPYTEFRDADGNSFTSAAAAKIYIDAQANVGVGAGRRLLGELDTLNFSLDGTGTSILIDNGDSYGVNTITAVANSDNHINILTHTNDVVLFKDLRLGKASINGSTVTQTLATAVTELNNLFAGISIVQDTSNFFHYDDNSALTGRAFNSAKGPAYWGQSLKAGEEMFFANNVSGVLLVGKFGGATSVVGQTAAATSNWDRRIGIDGQSDVSADGNQRYSSTEFQIGREMDGSGSNNFAMRYDSTTNKLQFIDFSHSFEMVIGQATAAEDGNPITMFFQAMSDSDTFTGNVTLPAITHRKVDLILHAEHTAGDVTDDDYTNGVVEDAVFSMNKPLNKGEKLKFTPQTNHGAQAILFDYTGSSGSGTGQTGVESRTNAGLIFAAHDDDTAFGNVTSSTGFTINQYSSRYSTSSRTSNQVGREMSIRYHTDNKIDLYDETAEEILFTKNSDADGNPITLFLAGLADDSGSDKVLHLKGLNMEAVGTDMSPRCHHTAFTVGTNSNVSINSDPNQNKNRLYGDTNNNSSGIPRFNDQNDRAQFGAKLRPGMESAFTGPTSFLTTTANRARGNQLGVSTGVSVAGNDWSWRVAFSYYGVLLNDELIGNSIVRGEFIELNSTDASGSNRGDDILLDGTDGSSSNAGGKIVLEENDVDLHEDLTGVVMRLRYEHSTNFLHLDAIQSGVRKRIATGNVSLGGDEILLTNSGDDAKALGLGTPYFYGMEYVHTATAYPQEYRGYNNQFLDWPTQNTTLKAETVVRHIDGIMPGYKIHWTLPTESGNSIDFFFGDWKTSNASSGLTGNSSDTGRWNWGFDYDHSSEKILASNLHNMHFNERNSFYNPGVPDVVNTDVEFWQRPNNQNQKTNVSWRYHKDNTIDLFDEDKGQVILNYITGLDGSAFKFAWVAENDLSNSFQPGYVTNGDPKVERITDVDPDVINDEVNNLLRGKTPLLGAGWYVAYGPNAGDKKNTPLSNVNHHPVYYSIPLRYRHEMTFNFPEQGLGGSQTANSNYQLQVWKGNQSAPAGSQAMQINNVDVAFGIHNDGLETDTTFGTDLTSDVALTDGEQLVLRFDYDGYLRLLRPGAGYTILATSLISFLPEKSLYIHMSGDENASDGSTPTPGLVQRGDFWKIVAYDETSTDGGYDTDDWRDASLDENVAYQTIRPLKLGQKYTGLTLPANGTNHYYGIAHDGWTGDTEVSLTSTSHINPNIGIGGAGTNFNWHTSESFSNHNNVDFNTSNSNYSSDKWNPGSGGQSIEFRYITSTKKVEVWDATNNEKILTSTNVMDANGGDVHLVVVSIQNNLNDALWEYGIANN